MTTPRDVNAAAWFAAASVAAAPLLSLRGTVLVGLAACAADLVLLVCSGLRTDRGAYSDWVSVATTAGLAVFLNRLLHRRDMRLRSVTGIAAAVQRAVLPQPPSRIGSLRIAARYEAAQSDAQLGGDLYAVHDTPYGVRCLIGDVRGKGLSAVETVTVVLGAFREGAYREPTLIGLAESIERTLLREAAQREELDRLEVFTTALLAEFSRPGDQLRLVNRGHPAPLFLWKGTVRQVEPSQHALPLGLAPLGADTVPLDTVHFPEGASLLLYTDGVTEARDVRGRFYDPADRLTGQCHRSQDDLLATVVADVHQHIGDQVTDDMALLVLTRHGPSGTEPRSAAPCPAPF
ncbi:PP2C family protein-serine/threonine phosphatase [Streptomyces collinus]